MPEYPQDEDRFRSKDAGKNSLAGPMFYFTLVICVLISLYMSLFGM